MLKWVLSLLESKGSETLSDEELVQRYLESGNNYFFEIIYHRYSKKIFGKCLTLVKNEVLAEDLTQDILMKIILNLANFSGRSKLSTWIYSITYNYCIDHIRQLKKRNETNLEDDIEIADSGDEIEDKVLMEVKLNQLRVIMDKLNEGDKSVLMMKYMDNMSIVEIADMTKKSESAIKMQIKRAKHKFSRIYEEAF